MIEIVLLLIDNSLINNIGYDFAKPGCFYMYFSVGLYNDLSYIKYKFNYL